MKVLMMGNPNVGKSLLFNRLTGARAQVSNYPGTTVDFTKGYIDGGERIEIVDVPGTFSLAAKDRAEEVAARMLQEAEDAIVLSVIDATKMERGLYLAMEVAERGRPMIVALNMMDVAKEKHIHIDAAGLEELLGVPVVAISAMSGEGLKGLRERLKDARTVDVPALMERTGVAR
jgi:ferrous iron transport protein B